MLTITDKQSLREQLIEWHQVGGRVALVPTMGNLHKGHLSLVELASQHAEHVVVSVFVNPTQFGPGEDFAEYPRTPEKDERLLKRAGVDVLYCPTVEDIYPNGAEGAASVSMPALTSALEGDHRPGHFDGVMSVVLRLFNIVCPNIAVFGQKDYQQLMVLSRMVDDLHLPVKLLAGETFREDSGLAMSSRNQYLTDEELEIAPALYRALNDARDKLLAGETDIAKIESTAKTFLEQQGFVPDYFAVRRAGDLAAVDSPLGKLIIVAAAQLGKARLIDNLLVEN